MRDKRNALSPGRPKTAAAASGSNDLPNDEPMMLQGDGKAAEPGRSNVPDSMQLQMDQMSEMLNSLVHDMKDVKGKLVSVPSA